MNVAEIEFNRTPFIRAACGDEDYAEQMLNDAIMKVKSKLISLDYEVVIKVGEWRGADCFIAVYHHTSAHDAAKCESIYNIIALICYKILHSGLSVCN